jgi:hypothetical protein
MIRKAHHMTAPHTRPLALRVVDAASRLLTDTVALFEDEKPQAYSVGRYCEACDYRVHFGKCPTSTDLEPEPVIYF